MHAQQFTKGPWSDAPSCLVLSGILSMLHERQACVSYSYSARESALQPSIRNRNEQSNPPQQCSTDYMAWVLKRLSSCNTVLLALCECSYLPNGLRQRSQQLTL